MQPSNAPEHSEPSESSTKRKNLLRTIKNVCIILVICGVVISALIDNVKKIIDDPFISLITVITLAALIGIACFLFLASERFPLLPKFLKAFGFILLAVFAVFYIWYDYAREDSILHGLIGLIALLFTLYAIFSVVYIPVSYFKDGNRMGLVLKRYLLAPAFLLHPNRLFSEKSSVFRKVVHAILVLCVIIFSVLDFFIVNKFYYNGWWMDFDFNIISLIYLFPPFFLIFYFLPFKCPIYRTLPDDRQILTVDYAPVKLENFTKDPFYFYDTADAPRQPAPKSKLFVFYLLLSIAITIAVAIIIKVI